ncbi:3-oxoacyl-ACP reductase [Pseudomonas sp. 21]|uniref:SDR family NAD(P)-dependent oxidoreductase n=1 Tax=unclassified Pseudomonas TaxID=196821 RepID=UPI0005EB74DA|nr:MULTISPECIES: SDR family oxidoreductase [unclassified Pseudomonas]KJK03252.1 3-oxoacyl-ACP reductase [Pseudomonas sp. 21]MBV7584760.1 SDR family oxidoreductase [Pseudomonas sp. PDM33]
MQRVALVTGAARGLGEVIARRLHAAGLRVALADLNEDAVQRLADELDPEGRTALGLKLDAREKADFERARDVLAERWGGTDILVNNAGMSKVAALMDISPEDFDASMAVNLRGTFVACQVFGTHFATRGFGRIVNIASLAGQNGGTATGGHYAAAKGGVATLTKVFARELSAQGVTVNAISPGPLDLPVVYESVAPERLEQILKTIPAGCLGDPTFIADSVLLLCAENAGSVTGACWDINGGLFMR